MIYGDDCMRKILMLLLALFMTVTLISGCSKSSNKQTAKEPATQTATDIHNRVMSIPYGANLDTVLQIMGNPNNVLEEYRHEKTGYVTGGKFVWVIGGLDDGWVEITVARPPGFSKHGFCIVKISDDFALAVADENNYISKINFDKKTNSDLAMQIRREAMNIDLANKRIGCKGVLVKRAAVNLQKKYPQKEYVWFDKQGNSFKYSFDDALSYRTKFN